jgi:hypothetical protein
MAIFNSYFDITRGETQQIQAPMAMAMAMSRLWQDTSRKMSGKAGLSKSRPCWNELTL